MRNPFRALDEFDVFMVGFCGERLNYAGRGQPSHQYETFD